MKKTNWAVLTAALVAMATVPASAAKLTVNGTLTNYWEYENSDLIPNGLLQNMELEVKLGITEGDMMLKLQVPFKLDGFQSSSDALKVAVDDGWYLDFTTNSLAASLSDTKDDVHKFEAVGDPMGLGNTLFDQIIYKNEEDKTVSHGCISDSNFIASELMHELSLDSEFPNHQRLTVDPDILAKVSGNVGSFDYLAYYAKSDVNRRGLDSRLEDPYGVGTIVDSDLSDLHTFILRGTYGIGDSVKIGGIVTYLHYGDNLIDDVATQTDINYNIVNLGLDVTGKIPVIGGNFAIAGAATAQRGLDDTFEYIKDGHAFSVELSEIPVSILKLGVSFAGSQKNAFSPLADRDSIMHTPDTMKLGASVGATVDVQGVALELEFKDTLSGDFFKSFNNNIAKLTASVKPSDKYSLAAGLKNEYAWDEVDGKKQTSSTTSIGLAAKGNVNENLQINGDVEFGFGDEGTLIANAYAIYASELPASKYVQSSDIKVAGLFGFNGNNSDNDEEGFNDIFYKIYAGFDSQIKDNVDANAGFFLGRSVLNVNGPTKVVGSVTAKYDITPALTLSGTYTYRNWEINVLGSEDTDDSTVEPSNHFAGISLALKAAENTFVKLSWGNDGLASASKLKYENIKPWSYLEINPTSRVMKTDRVRLDVSIGF